MRILHVNTTASRGGAALIARRLHLWQQEAGCESRLLVARDPSDIEAGIVSLNETRNRFLMNVFAYRALGREGLFNARLWTRVLAEIGEVDAIHIHNAHGYYMPEDILGLLLSKPTVWTLHDFWLASGGPASPEVAGCLGKGYPVEWIDRSRRRRDFLAQLVREYNPVLVAPTVSSAEKLKEIGLSGRNLHVVHHGVFDSMEVPNESERRAFRDMLGWSPETHVFVFASSTVDNKQKGFEVFLAALLKLPRDLNWLAYVVGGATENSRSLVQDSGLPSIHFAGSLENSRLRQCFQACDTYVTATFSESYGLTVVEALGEGASVVCSDLSVLREVSNGCATYFPVGDSEALAECLLKEIRFGKDQTREGRADYIRRRYSKDSMLKSYARLYARAMGAVSAPIQSSVSR